MKNLKRALSLALSSVMLLGMMVVGTGAASYDDVTADHNVEAIEVLKTVGVMEGDGTGFNPDAKVTRNEMAVVMSKLMDYRVATYAGTSPFTDVPEWAEPYVAACYTNGITTGISATNYGGDNTVTTAQAALMLMKALGYFQYQSDFDEDWQLATTRQGAKIGLFDGVQAGVKEPMTRNDVAQLVLNTLRSGMVEADNDVLNVNTGDVSVQAGKVDYYYVVSQKAFARQIDTVTATYNGVSGNVVELGEKLYGGNLTRNGGVTDSFGRPSTNWTYKSTSIGTFSADPIATYTSKVTKDTLYSLLGASTVSDLTQVNWALNTNTIQVNGQQVAVVSEDELVVYVDGLLMAPVNGKSDFIARNSSAGAKSGNGVLTEVYLDDDGNVTLVYINTYLMQATSDYNEKKGTINVTALTQPEAGMGNMNAYNNIGTVLDVDDFAGITELKADDYILYTASAKNGWGVASVEKAQLTQGTVEAYAHQGWVKVDGNTLQYAKFIEGSDNWTEAPTNDAKVNSSATIEYVITDTASLVLDKYGYVIFVDDASVSLGNYVFIEAVDTENNFATSYGVANAYFPDGTNAVITLKNIWDAAQNNNKGAYVAIDATNDNQGNDDLDQIPGAWYAYTKDSAGRYSLKIATSNDSDSNVNIKTDKASIGGLGLADKNTVFLIQETNGNKNLYIATGIANVPEIQNADVWSMKAKDDSNKKLSLVYVEATKQNIKNAATEDLLYLLKLSYTYVDTTDGEVVTVWDALLNGVKTTIETKEDWTARNMYVNYRIDSDGYYEKGDLFTDEDAANDELVAASLSGAALGLSGGTLSLGSNNYYVVVADTTVVTLVLDAKTNDAGTALLQSNIMNDDAAAYEVTENMNVNSLAGLFNKYLVNGEYFAVLEDDDNETDVAKSLTLIVKGVTAAP